MKRPLKRNGRAATSHPGAARFAAALLCGLFAFVVGCTGTIGAMHSGAGGASNPSGSGGSGMGGGQTGGSAGPGTAGQGGSTGLGGDPYAIPSSPPATVLVATPRVARLSRPQWSNAVRDLLKLTDISEIDSGVTGDALDRFRQRSRRPVRHRAAARAAVRRVGEAGRQGHRRRDRAGAPRPGERAHGRGRESQGVHHLVRTARLPAAAHRRGGDHARRALQSRRRRSTPGSTRSRRARAWSSRRCCSRRIFLYRTELGTATAGATKVPLNDWEVAAKLAFSITNTMPDDTLFAAAAAGQLHDKAAVAAQAKRLLDGPTGTVGLSNFNLQVYRLGTYDGITRDADGVPGLQAQRAGGDEAGGAAVPRLDVHAGPRDQGLLHDAGRFRERAARAALWRDRQLLERPAHAHEGRPRSRPALGSAHPGRVPVLVYLGGQRAGHHPPRRLHRDPAPVQGAAAARPRRRRNDASPTTRT